VILYSSSNFACGSSSRGAKVTLNSSLTAKTLSLAKYLQSLSNICVVRGLWSLWRTKRWICAGRKGCRSIIFRRCPAGPSSGTYDTSATGLQDTLSRFTHWVWSRSQAVERVVTILVRDKLTTEVQVALVGILLFIQPCIQVSTRIATSKLWCLPLVEACQTSTVAPEIGSPVVTFVTRPCMNAT
jgi:hypothetical protein